jgi:DNA-binding LacI/PurR family transcriptional regulator
MYRIHPKLAKLLAFLIWNLVERGVDLGLCDTYYIAYCEIILENCDTCRILTSMSQRRPGQSAQRNEFAKIALEIQHRIEGGDIAVGRFLPTERELQEEFGVSRSTVRRALARLVSEGWAENVPSRGVMASSGFVKVTSANIALIDGSTYVLRVLTHRLSGMLREAGYHLVHLDASGSVAVEDALEYALENKFAGAIVWPFRGFADAAAMTRLTTNMPVVFLDHILEGARADFVTFDNLAAAEEATNHLVRQGCQRIGITGQLDMLEVTHKRFSGYMKALFANNLAPHSRDFVFSCTSAMKTPDSYHMDRRFRDSDRPDGMLVIQDEFVPSTIEAALRAGLRVPQDIKIVTIGDDIELNVNGRGLTSEALDWDAMAEAAIKLLLDRIENPTRELKVFKAPHQLIVRGSCGAPEGEWTVNPDQLSGFHGNFPYPRSQYQYSSTWSVHDPDPDPQSR